MQKQSIVLDAISEEDTHVCFTYSGSRQVEVTCNGEEGTSCMVHIGTFPTRPFELLSTSEASSVDLISTSGPFLNTNPRQSATADTEISSGGTSLFVTTANVTGTVIDNFATVRASLSALLHLPMSNTSADIGASKPIPVHFRSGPHHDARSADHHLTASAEGSAAYSQVFPTLRAAPDTWKYWARHFLSHPVDSQGVSVLELMDVTTLRAASWYSLRLRASSASSARCEFTASSAEDARESASSSSGGCELASIDETRPGRYNISYTVTVELVVPESLPVTAVASSLTAAASKVSAVNIAGSDLLSRIREYSLDSLGDTSHGQAVQSTLEIRRPSSGGGVEALAINLHSPDASSGDTRQDVEEFWQQIRNPVAADTPRKDAEVAAAAAAASPYIALNRRVFDSRSELFTVLTTMHRAARQQSVLETSPSTVAESASAGTAERLRYTEVLPDHYDIDLRSFTYQLRGASASCDAVATAPTDADASIGKGHCVASGDAERGRHVAHLPGLAWTTTDCELHHVQPDSSDAGLFDSWLWGASSSAEDVFLAQYASTNSAAADLRCFRTLSFELPALSAGEAFVLTYHANKRFVTREYQPVGASRGAQMPPSYLTQYACLGGQLCGAGGNSTYGSGGGGWQTVRTQYTSSHVLTTSIPDASMPFNVITLVSTLLAFFMGSFANAILKSRSPAGNTKSAKAG